MDEEYDTSLRPATIGTCRAVHEWRYESASRYFAARCQVPSLRNRSSDKGAASANAGCESVVDRTAHSIVGLISARTWDGRRPMSVAAVWDRACWRRLSRRPAAPAPPDWRSMPIPTPRTGTASGAPNESGRRHRGRNQAGSSPYSNSACRPRRSATRRSRVPRTAGRECTIRRPGVGWVHLVPWPVAVCASAIRHLDSAQDVARRGRERRGQVAM